MCVGRGWNFSLARKIQHSENTIAPTAFPLCSCEASSALRTTGLWTLPVPLLLVSHSWRCQIHNGRPYGVGLKAEATPAYEWAGLARLGRSNRHCCLDAVASEWGGFISNGKTPCLEKGVCCGMFGELTPQKFSCLTCSPAQGQRCSTWSPFVSVLGSVHLVSCWVFMGIFVGP